MTPTEREAEAYADSIDRRGCAFWQGMYRGYIAGHYKARNQAIQECIDEIERLNDNGVLHEHTIRIVLNALKT